VRRLVDDAINAELEAVGLPTIDVRLGLDGGEAAIIVLGSDKSKRHADLIGEVVSLPCKIESRADTGEIFLGETVHRNLHFSWRELCSACIVVSKDTRSVDLHKRTKLRLLGRETLEVRLLRADSIGKVVRFAGSGRGIPTTRILCLPPGAAKPGPC